jgi:acetylornithine deacetylase/succinyl-diaminopimelate desuccinylase-like protein
MRRAGRVRIAAMDAVRVAEYCDRQWQESALPALVEYIRIPNKSPAFDPEWEQHGHMERAVQHIAAWCRARPVAGLSLEIVRLPGRTPLIYMEAPGEIDDTVLLYGHLDKQPEMTGWREGLGPWLPVIEGDRLYGRGGADDGYAAFASLIALEALLDQKLPRPRCVVIIEACEESGSYDLPHYIDALAGRIGRPSLVVCLDSGCGNYEQLWCTTSLRGLVGGTLRIEVLREGVHSGDAGGIVPCSFRILRRLLDRIDDSATGIVRDAAFNVEIPQIRLEQARRAAGVLGKAVFRRFPLAGGTRPPTDDAAELILNRTWRPTLTITGIGGVPEPVNAGNVLRPWTEAKVSLRIPPTCDPARARDTLRNLLESDPPDGARVTFTPDWAAGGWHAPPMEDWLATAVDEASMTFFGAPAMHMGEGGTIPFMAMLGEKFPEAQFLITGVLGPGANAHGPNEFLHVPTARKLSACVAHVLAARSKALRRS